MDRRFRRRLRPPGASALVLGVSALLLAASPEGVAGFLRERAVDAVLLRLDPADAGAVAVVDIDQASLDAEGPWPWPRERLAALVAAVAAAGASVVAVDILLEGPDRASPETLARALAARSGDPAATEAVARLPDPDAGLAAAIGGAPVVLAALLGAAGTERTAATPVAIAGPPPALKPWRAAGAALPHAPFREAASEVAVASLQSGADGRIRSVPLFAVAGGDVLAGLALAALRRREEAALYVLDGAKGELRIGTRVLPLTAAAELRVRPSRPELWRQRSVSATDLIAGRVPADLLRSKVVMLGGSAPALGALRPTAASPVTPSVQIQADALETMLSGVVPVRRDGAWRLEAGAAAALGLAGIAGGTLLGPGLATLAAVGAAAAWGAGAIAALVVSGAVVDPVTPALAALIGATVAALVTAIDTRRAAASVRRRFERHLAPAVVQRIVDDPELAKLAGERREVTALFTDIEGFTATAEAHAAEVVVDLLDRYFDGVTALVTAHGGMVDKIVGDAVHALFNAPLDLDGHAEKAVRCALAIIAFTEAFGARPDVAPLGLGRTRIGIETGPAVVGDVGSGEKLDYTAHGGAVNTAARLEALNKTLGTPVCVGPVCRARVTGVAFRPLGAVEVRGRGFLELYEPLPYPAQTPAPRPPVRGPSASPPRGARPAPRCRRRRPSAAGASRPRP